MTLLFPGMGPGASSASCLCPPVLNSEGLIDTKPQECLPSIFGPCSVDFLCRRMEGVFNMCEVHSIFLQIVIHCSSLLQYNIPCVNLDHKSLIFFTLDRNLAGFWFGAIPNGVVTDMLTNVF